MMTYAHEIWYEQVSAKSTYMEIIIKLQRRVMAAVTGAYRNANSRKILEIANGIPIEIELRVLNETLSLSRDEHRPRVRAAQAKRGNMVPD